MSNIIKSLTAGMAILLGLSGCGSPPQAEAGIDYQTAMVDLICDLKEYSQAQRPGFALLGNGGSPLYVTDDGNSAANAGRLLQALDGQLCESIFYRWDVAHDCAMETKGEETAYFERTLEVPLRAGMPVFSLDYVDSAEMEEDSYKQNREHGYIGWASYRRELDQIPQTQPRKTAPGDCRNLKDVQDYLVLLNPGRFPSREDYLSSLGQTDYDLLIIDFYYGPEQLSPEEVRSLQTRAGGGRRLVFAYMSVGEAETYRPYWQKEWEEEPPGWIAVKNEAWQDNYKVKYWSREWRNILYGSEDAYLDKIMAAGFDGAFLDVVDAYYYFLASEAEQS